MVLLADSPDWKTLGRVQIRYSTVQVRSVSSLNSSSTDTEGRHTKIWTCWQGEMTLGVALNPKQDQNVSILHMDIWLDFLREIFNLYARNNKGNYSLINYSNHALEILM